MASPPTSRPTEIGWNTDDDEDLQPKSKRKSTDSDLGSQQTRQPLKFSSDANESIMVSRKRAMALGKFRLMSRDADGFLDEENDFKEAVDRFDPNTVRFFPKPRGFPKSNYPKTRYSSPRIHFRGIGNRFHVIWTSEDEFIHMDRLVKVYDIESVHLHEIDVSSDGPKSPWFALVDPRQIPTYDGLVHFDANM